MESVSIEQRGPGTVTEAEDPALALSQRAKFEILGAVLLGLFLGALDQTIVGPVLPRIVSDLKGADYYTWAVAIYLLTSTVTVPIYGKLSDLYGRKPLLIFGISLFLIGSALSGLSQEMWQLILFRGIQGLGAGALFPIALAVIGDLFTPAERGKYQGLFGLVALAVIGRLLPNMGRTGRKVRVDYLGVVTLVLALVPILLGFTFAESGNWGDASVWGWILVGLVFLVIFVIVEGRTTEPIIPLHLFRNRTFSASMVAIFFATFGFGAAIIFLPLYFQIVEHSSATESGYKLLPFLFGLIFSSIVSGQIVSRTGRYKPVVIVGVTLLVVGLTLMTQLRADTPDLTLWGWMFIAGLGVGPTFAVFTIIVQNSVPFQELGTATSDLTLFRQIGTTIGISFAFTLFRNNLTWDLLRTELGKAGAPGQFLPATPPPGFDPGQLTAVSSGGANGSGLAFLAQLPANLQAIFVNGFNHAFTIAIANSMWLGVGAAVVAVVATFFLKEIPLRTTLGAQAPSAQPQGAPEAERGARPAFRPETAQD